VNARFWKQGADIKCLYLRKEDAGGWRNLMKRHGIRSQLDVTLCYPLFLFYKLLNMFRATMCPSSGADDCVVLSLRVCIVPSLQQGCQNRLAVSVSIEGFYELLNGHTTC